MSTRGERVIKPPCYRYRRVINTAELEVNEAKNLTVTSYNVSIKSCSKPNPQLAKRTHAFEVNATGVDDSYEQDTLGWIITSALSKEKKEGERSKIPGWAGFKSLVSSGQSLTNVGALPLLPEVALECVHNFDCDFTSINVEAFSH